MTTLAASTAMAARREARAGARDPGTYLLLPALPPLLMLVVFTALFDRLGAVAPLGGTGYVAYLVPGIVVLVALLGAGATASTLGADVRGGFVQRLRVVPAPLAAVVLGRLLVEGARLLPAAALVLGVGLVIGGRDVNGGLGVAIATGLVILLGAGYSGFFLAVAALTADPQTPLTLQPLGLPLAFLSTALVPVSIMPGWAETLARLNPVSVMVDGSRTAMLGDLGSREVGMALATGGGILVLATAVATLALHRAATRGGAA